VTWIGEPAAVAQLYLIVQDRRPLGSVVQKLRMFLHVRCVKRPAWNKDFRSSVGIARAATLAYGPCARAVAVFRCDHRREFSGTMRTWAN
jgi:hypothetical protein